MAKLIILIGLSGSGKTNYAESLEKTNRFIKVVSRNRCVEEFYSQSCRTHKDENKIYREMIKSTKKYLQQGYDVIFDDANIKRKTRVNLIKEFKEYASEIQGHIIWAPYTDCIQRKCRNNIEKAAIKEQLYKWHSPFNDEGFDTIQLIYNCNVGWNRIQYTCSLLNDMNINHDNKFHQYTIKDHCARAEEYCYNKYFELPILAEAAAYHDIGKPITKTFKSDSEGNVILTAHYYQHDNVGSYLVYGCYDVQQQDKALTVSWLVCYHMHPYFDSDYYKNLHGTSKMWLDMLHEADVAAH